MTISDLLIIAAGVLMGNLIVALIEHWWKKRK